MNKWIKKLGVVTISGEGIGLTDEREKIVV